MKLNLTVTNYLLPSQQDDLFIENIESYGKEFWDDVDTNLIFKKEISDTLKDVLTKYGINYTCGVDDNWLTVMHEAVENVKTDYFMVFLEDITIIDKDAFMECYSKLKLIQADCMPTIDTGLWNRIAEVYSNHTEVQSDDEYNLMSWGTEHSVFCEQPHVKQPITTASSTPYPISLAGIFKKSFFLDTCEKMKGSQYWANITADRDCYQHTDWAMNPRLPHSYEVYWVHNKRTEDVLYSILVSKRQLSTSNDVKDKIRGLYKN